MKEIYKLTKEMKDLFRKIDLNHSKVPKVKNNFDLKEQNPLYRYQVRVLEVIKILLISSLLAKKERM